MAPLRLKRVYSAAGLRPQGLEPSDFLPVMPEFAELAEGGLGAHILAEHRTAVEVRRAQLQEKWSPYLHLIDAVRFDLPHLHKADLEVMRSDGPPETERPPRQCQHQLGPEWRMPAGVLMESIAEGRQRGERSRSLGC